MNHGVRNLSVFVVIVALLGLVVSCSDEEESAGAGDDLRPVTGTPTAIAEVPEDIEEAQLEIEDGELVEDEFNSVAGQPVMLTIVNRDDETYAFVVPDLITETEIKPAGETGIEFTAPEEQTVEGKLLGPSGDDLDTIFVEITGPGGT